MTGIIDPYDYEYRKPLQNRCICVTNRKDANRLFDALDNYPTCRAKYELLGRQRFVSEGLKLFDHFHGRAYIFLSERSAVTRVIEVRLSFYRKWVQNPKKYTNLGLTQALKLLSPHKIKPIVK